MTINEKLNSLLGKKNSGWLKKQIKHYVSIRGTPTRNFRWEE